MALAHERAEGSQQRRVGELGVALLDRLPAEDEHVLAGQSLLELSDQPRLADAGVASEQYEHGTPGLRLTPRELQFR